jgi:hypothetical protein
MTNSNPKFKPHPLIRSRISDVLKKYSTEISLFSLFFIIIFSSLTLYTGPGSNENVEQWINLTNQMFYGKQDFLFSYGPLYWLNNETTTQYNTYTYWLTIAFVSISSACFWAFITTLTHKTRAYFFLAAAYFLFFKNLLFPATLFLYQQST